MGKRNYLIVNAMKNENFGIDGGNQLEVTEEIDLELGIRVYFFFKQIRDRCQWGL